MEARIFQDSFQQSLMILRYIHSQYVLKVTGILYVVHSITENRKRKEKQKTEYHHFAILMHYSAMTMVHVTAVCHSVHYLYVYVVHMYTITMATVQV